MVGGTMTATAKPDDRHPGRDRRLHADGAVFDYEAALARHIEPPCREQEEVGRGLASRDLRGAENMRIEERQQPRHRKRMADPIEVAVRSDAARHRQRCEELFDARYRGQLGRERDIDMAAERLEEPVGESAPEPRLDLGGQGDPVLAETEHHRLLHRDRKVGGDQTLAENSAEDDFAVDQHTIAIEDDESRHERSLSGAGCGGYMALYHGLSSCTVA